MARYLATFFGPYGDIIWSLASVKHISENIVRSKLDFAMASGYSTLIPLLEVQPYIDRAYSIDEWLPIPKIFDSFRKDRWYADPKVEVNYEKAWHFTWQGRWIVNEPIMCEIDYFANQKGFQLKNPLPFIFIPKRKRRRNRLIAWSFNDSYIERKMRFISKLQSMLKSYEFVRTDSLSWVNAAKTLRDAACFVGCRSSNCALAYAVGQKNIIVYEPHVLRHAYSWAGEAFGCSYNTEFTLPISVSSLTSARIAAKRICEISNG